MGETVVLTGASGCIGFHTLSLLIERDDRVAEIRCLDLRKPEDRMRNCIDELLRQFNDQQVEHNSTDLKKKIVTWIQGDIRDINLVERLLEGAHCVIHAAAKIQTWTHWVDQDEDELRSVNVQGTENLLKTAQRLGVHKFIHVSSFETYVGYDTIYYATENTLPESKTFLFGASGSTKWDAENKVRQYANVKLNQNKSEHQDQLLAIIIRFSTVYGEYDNHFVSQILKMTKFFNGKLQRFSNIWIKQQPIYARNAAWSLVKAKQRLDIDKSISGEEFHITDDTDIEDPFDFIEPYLESHGMRVTKESYPFIPAWIMLWLIFTVAVFLRSVDIFGLFSDRKSRYQEAIQKDRAQPSGLANTKSLKRWYHYLMPQTLCFMCMSSFLNRTKASLRLDYEPIVSPIESRKRSLEWYKDGLNL